MITKARHNKHTSTTSEFPEGTLVHMKDALNRLLIKIC